VCTRADTIVQSRGCERLCSTGADVEDERESPVVDTVARRQPPRGPSFEKVTCGVNPAGGISGAFEAVVVGAAASAHGTRSLTLPGRRAIADRERQGRRPLDLAQTSCVR